MAGAIESTLVGGGGDQLCRADPLNSGADCADEDPRYGSSPHRISSNARAPGVLKETCLLVGERMWDSTDWSGVWKQYLVIPLTWLDSVSRGFGRVFLRQAAWIGLGLTRSDGLPCPRRLLTPVAFACFRVFPFSINGRTPFEYQQRRRSSTVLTFNYSSV